MTAIEHREYTLSCDSPVHHQHLTAAFYGAPLIHEPSRAKLRKRAAKLGWTHVRSDASRKDDKDFCPQHQPVTPPEVVAGALVPAMDQQEDNDG